MKKTIYARMIFSVICVILCVCSFGIELSASEESERGSYTVAQGDGGYVLSEYESGVPLTLLCGSATEVFSRILSLPENSEIVFSSVVVSEDVELYGANLVFGGALSFSSGASLIVGEDAHISFDGLTLGFASSSEGFLRIKGGSLVMTDSSIFSSRAGAVLVDYSASSSFTMISGVISAESEEAALRVDSGSLYVLGGSIYNTSGVGISCDSSLYLAGSPTISGIGYDIVTEKPINLSFGESYYIGGSPLLVKFCSELRFGEMTLVFRNARGTSLDRITLYDKFGVPWDITYFDSSVHTSERNFCAVYQPYTVKLFDYNGAFSERYLLAGEVLTEPEPTDRAGFDFLGWYTDSEGNNKYDFNLPVTSSLALYPLYSLEPPSFKINSVNTVYDGEEHALSFEELSHALDGEGGFYSYEWFRDGELVSTAPSLRYKNTSDSGKYECIVSFSYKNASVSVEACNITLNIEKLRISPPEIEPLQYSGAVLTPSILPSSLYTFVSVGETDVGRYGVTFSLTDTEGYAWRGSDSSEIEVEFEILKADNRWSEELTAADSYPNAIPNHNATALFGSVKYLYSQSEDGEYTDGLPHSPGIYYVKAVVEESRNYSGLVSSPISFTVKAESVISMSVASYPEKASYTAFERLDGRGVSLLVKYDSGREEIVGIEKISVLYQSGDSFRYGDSAVILSYKDTRISLPVTVVRADYDISGIELSDFSVIYNGGYQSADISIPSIVGEDGIPLEISLSGGGREVGNYKIKLSFSVSSTSYNIPDEITANMEILPLEVMLVWSELFFTYDGTAHVPTAYYIDAFGVVRYPSVSGSAVYAGEDYSASVISASKNYVFKNSEVLFDIEKASFDLSNVKWSSQIFVYNGEKQEVSVSGLPDGLRLVGYSDCSGVEAGEYLATAYVSYDERNYNSPGPITFSWKIEPLEYDISSLVFSSASVVYDGNIHYPSVLGELTAGIDGSLPSYVFSNGATHVSEGRVAVHVLFTSGSKNYRAPAPITLYVEILPRGISVTWGDCEFVYSGDALKPTATAGESSITVNGEQINAGSYFAEAVADNSDFYVINSTHPFTISPAQNEWILSPSIDGIFESGTLSPSGEAISGEISFKYYSDESCFNEIDEPTSSGVYYAVAIAGANSNYTTLYSEPIEFEIIEVVAVRLSVELVCAEHYAFRQLASEDFRAVVYYNDGSERVISADSLAIVYENASSLRCADEHVTFKHFDLVATVPVEVKPADYDTSAVVWINTEAVYDGKLKSPVLTGLPAGVSVISYIGADSASAGAYTVSAVLSYDSENYNPPNIPSCELVISKRTLLPPDSVSVVYNGLIQLPCISDEFVIKDAIGYKNAGVYTVTLGIADFENYCFESGATECNLTFEITPRPIYVKVDDMLLYRWESPSEVSWHITEGECIEGDSLSVASRVEDGLVSVYSCNPNYVIYSEAGRLERLSYPSPSVMGKIFIVLLSVILLLMIGFVIYIFRGRVVNAFGKIRSFFFDMKSRESVPIEALPTDARDGVNPSANDADTSYIQPEEEAPKEDADGEPTEDGKIEENKDDDGENKGKTGVFDFDFGFSIDSERADLLISDQLAKELIRREKSVVDTRGRQKGIINVDTLSDNFSAGERVDVNILKSKSLVPYDTAYIKVLARGIIDKPLTVYANDFSLAAVKMIALSGGEAVKVRSSKCAGKIKKFK